MYFSAISDTCIAMEEWANNSQVETSLSNILTCVDQKTSNQTLIQSELIVNAVVDVVNMAINVGANINPSHKSVFYLNQSGPFMPHLCSPFDSDLNDRPCGPKDVSLANASSVCFIYIIFELYILFCCEVNLLRYSFFLNKTRCGKITHAKHQQLAYAPQLGG